MDEGIMALSIPIIAIIMGCAIPILGIIMEFRQRKLAITALHQERMAAIEKGLEPTPWPDFLMHRKSPFSKHPRRFLRQGLILLFLGLSIAGALYMYGKTEGAYFGFIPASIGLALILYYKIEGQRESADFEKEQAARKAAQSSQTTA